MTTLLSECAASGQMDSRQIHAHQMAGELDDREARLKVAMDAPITKPVALVTAEGALTLVDYVMGALAIFFISGLTAWIVWNVLPVTLAYI